ncbi:RluA family pseudouridine synthase [Desulfurobacterium sp.]
MNFIAYRIRNCSGTLEFVISEITGISRRKVKKIVDEGLVSINGVKVLKRRIVVRKGDVVEFGVSSYLFSRSEIAVIYEDDFIIAVNKPPFLNSNRDFPDVESILKRKYKDVRAIHRLDRQTSGVLLFAKDDDVFEKMVAVFRKRSIKKTYRAVVFGKFEGERRVSVSLDGREALTRVRMLRRCGRATEVLVSIETGRKHQIRRHLSFLGYPVAGEFVYFRGAYPFLLRFAPRIMLHAEEVAFRSPFTGREVKITAPIFDDFSDFLKVLERGREALPLKEYA